MRPKNIRSAPPPPPRDGINLTNVGIALGLLVLGGSLVVGGQLLLNGIGAGASATSIPTLAPEASVPLESLPVESVGPSESPAVASAFLEAKLPATIAGTQLTRQSATDAITLSSGPSGRALDAAVVSFGKTAQDLEIAVAYDESGTLDLTVLGFRLPGIDAERLKGAILGSWLETDVAGVKTSTLELSGIPTTRVSYGDKGPDEFLFIEDDAVFVIETSDEALATTVAGAIASAPTPSIAPASPSPAASMPARSPASSPSQSSPSQSSPAPS
jgi:hypothetical protein